MKTIDHPYRPKAWTMAWACLFFGAIAALMIVQATSNDRGLVVNGVVHLASRGATVFFWGMAAVCGLFVAVGIPAVWVSLFGAHRLVLTAEGLSAPRSGLSRKATVVPLGSITGLDVQVIQGQRMLNIRHAAGKLTVMQSWLPNEAAFDELLGALAAAVEAPAEDW